MGREELKNWVPFSRQIASDKKNGKLTHNEYQLYMWIRISANPYGVASINNEALIEDVFAGDSTVNSINKIILSLKRKRYVYYLERSGRTGSYEVHLGDFILPDRSIKRLDDFFGDSEMHKNINIGQATAEPNQSIILDQQRLNSEKTVVNTIQSCISSSTKRRGCEKHNDNNIENINRYIDRIPVDGFMPDSYESSRCKDIAESIDERYMDYLLSINHEHGINILENAFVLYKSRNNKERIKNKPAYFNSIVQSLISNRGP